MAIEKIRFSQTDVTNANLLAMRPSNIDTSGGFPDLGARILAAAEPAIKADVQERGMIAGAAAPIVKNEDGTYAVPEVPEAGTEYQAAFRNAMTVNYKNQVFFDYSKMADRFMAEHPRDAETFLAKAQGAAEGVLKTVPPEIAAEIRPDLNREILQRFGGITNRKSNEDRQVLLQSLGEQETNFLRRGSELIKLGTPKSIAQGELFYQQARETRLRLLDLTGATDPSGIVSFDTNVQTQRDIATGMAQDEAQRKADAARSRQETELRIAERLNKDEAYRKTTDLAGMLQSRVRELDDPQLELLDRMIRGNVADDERLVIGQFSFNRQEFLDAMPDQDALRNTLGYTTNAELGDRDRERVRRGAEAAQQKINDELLFAAEHGTGVNSQDAKDRLDTAANAFDMNTMDGQNAMSEFIARTGHVPKKAKTWLDMASRTTNLDPQEGGGVLFQAANFYADLKQLARRDPSRPGEVLNQGAVVISQLDTRTKNVLDFISATAKFRGTGPSVVAEAVRIVASGVNPLTSAEVRSRIPNYNKQADSLIREQFGIPEERAVPIYIRREFDDMYDILAQGFSAEDAISMATTSIKDEYEPNPAFDGGVGDKAFMQNMNPIALNKYMKTNFPSIDINFAAELGKSVRVMKSPMSTPGNPAYTFSYLDRAGNTTHKITIAKLQLPEVRMQDFTAQERLDAEIANAEAEYMRGVSVLASTGISPSPQLMSVYRQKRDDAVKRANDRFAIEVGATANTTPSQGGN